MTNWDAPQTGGSPDIPVVPIAAELPWWKRRVGKLPVWGWITGGFVALAGLGAALPSSDGDLLSTSGSTSTVAVVEFADIPRSTIPAVSTIATLPPTTPAPPTTVPTPPTTEPPPPTTAAPTTTIETTTTTSTTTTTTTTSPPTTTTTLPAPPPGPEISVAIHFDAAGNDNQNKNDEWVRFTNAGSAPVDLTNWFVEDEGAKHTHRFASLVLEPGDSVTLYTGCGDASQTERFFCNSGSAIWNNSGDVVSLFDSTSQLVAQRRG